MSPVRGCRAPNPSEPPCNLTAKATSFNCETHRKEDVDTHHELGETRLHLPLLWSTAPEGAVSGPNIRCPLMCAPVCDARAAPHASLERLHSAECGGDSAMEPILPLRAQASLA